MKIIVASTNQGKITEIRRLLGDLGTQVLTMEQAGIDPGVDLPENGDTFEQNALSKTGALQELVGEDYWCLGDDSGLEVDYLHGAPGVRSARYAGFTAQGAERDRANTKKLLDELQGVAASARQARFVCHMVLLGPKGQEIHSRGTCEGRILRQPRGTGGFGYDPVFLPDGFDRTMAELSLNEKNRISHRGKALSGLMKKIQEQGMDRPT